MVVTPAYPSKPPDAVAIPTILTPVPTVENFLEWSKKRSTELFSLNTAKNSSLAALLNLIVLEITFM